MARTATAGQMSTTLPRYPEREDLIRAIGFYRIGADSRHRGTPKVEVYYPTHRKELKQQIVWHSPDGFEFGYGGSGPADAALNILLLFVTDDEARKLHQDFKWEFVAAVDQERGGKIDAKLIRNWLEDRLRRDITQEIWTAAERGVAIVLLGWDWEMETVFDDPRRRDAKWPDFRGRRPHVCPVPPKLRYAFMATKAYAFCDGYYVALRQNGSELVRMVERGYIRDLPRYDSIKWRILDGDGFDDENVEGGDYILACRIALDITATLTRGLRETYQIPGGLHGST